MYRKNYLEIYKKSIVQVWILILALVVFLYATFMLIDLKNYKCVISDRSPNRTQTEDADGRPIMRVTNNIKIEITYNRNKFFRFYPSSDVGIKQCDVYWDIYAYINRKKVYVETVCKRLDSCANAVHTRFSNDYYDLEYGKGIVAEPRLENVKISFPASLIVKPLLLYLLSVPLLALSIYGIASIVRINRKYDINIDDISNGFNY